MHSLTFPAWFWPRPQTQTAREDVKRPTPKDGPVFIYDAVAPVQGTTLLHLLWNRWDTPADE